MPTQNPVLRVCSLLNAERAKYLIVGGHALILHGLVRATEDVDILIESSDDNCKRVLAALSRLEDGAAKELAPQDLRDNVVVKIADEVEVDVSTRAWKISYEDAAPSACEIEIDNVRVPYLGIDALIASKETYREKDHLDLVQLRALKQRKESGG
ncbi:MAG TPA: nucleotidyl transferase AbiEii/AbiGii toxin family protein [Candidatus Binatia bacterium]|nr:nucleotidyl transferase AbiEii/AbiGii toxin family protein [Candidatus Binatia bacterium]